MGKDPAVLFYTSDFLSGTSFFTMEQRGQYITLLCEQHQNGHIPEHHMKIICLSLDSIVAMKFIKDDNGLYYNERMENEHKKRVKYCESRGNNRKEGISKKSYDISYENHMTLHMDNENENRNDNGIKNRNSFNKPSVEEIKCYCIERKNSVDPQSFFDFYESKGWMIGKNKMKNWQACIRTWEKNNINKPKKEGFNKEEYLKEQEEWLKNG